MQGAAAKKLNQAQLGKSVVGCNYIYSSTVLKHTFEVLYLGISISC